jgi:hypothetical protein
MAVAEGCNFGVERCRSRQSNAAALNRVHHTLHLEGLI